MNTGLIILITVAGCLAAFALALYISVWASKHGVSLSTIKKVEKGLTLAETIATAIKPFFPGYADNIIDAVLKYAQEAVQRAENTYVVALQTNTNANDNRVSEADTWIKGSLAMENIKVTPEIQKLIDAVTPIFIRALPPTHSAAKQTAAQSK